ncbi:kinase-like protein [Phaeosphaeriaceae sp. SRC1lsM3a]|nr:kinase-like protein [Stagonospora sp. SRC1lsM3a]
MSDQEGLEWVNTTFGFEPRWTKEPDVNIIRDLARKHLGHDDEAPIEVNFHTQGAFNKLYRIEAAGSACLMRVSLPVYPHLKTRSEVVTVTFVRDQLGIPAPQILAFDSDSRNDLGFEWILMELIPGENLRKRWRRMSWDAKETIVKQLAQYQAQLHKMCFAGIGNLFPSAEGFANLELGPIVSLDFFWCDRLTYDVKRGPFANCHEWLQTRLQLAIADQERLLSTSKDDDDIEDAEFARDLAKSIAAVLPKVFAHEATNTERTVLFHNDLPMQNILVDKKGTIAAVLDWECVFAAPSWWACQFPHLLQGRCREVEPSRDHYMTDTADEIEKTPNNLDNEGVNSLFWEHKLEHEQTQLRKLFMQEMESLSPEWLATMKSHTVQADFERAIHNCDHSWTFKIVKRWLSLYKEGRICSLTDMLME